MITKEQLEEAIDHFGMSGLLMRLGSICNEKAEHIVSNWQDEDLAECWFNVGTMLDDLSDNVAVKVLGSPNS